jgi:hypothetical protein
MIMMMIMMTMIMIIMECKYQHKLGPILTKTCPYSNAIPFVINALLVYSRNT